MIVFDVLAVGAVRCGAVGAVRCGAARSGRCGAARRRAMWCVLKRSLSLSLSLSLSIYIYMCTYILATHTCIHAQNERRV